MDLEDEGPGPIGQGIAVIPKMRAVGSAYLYELGPGLAKNIWHPKPSADLYEFSSGDDHRATLRHCGEHEEYGGRPVVDHQPRLSAGRPGQEGGCMAPPVAPSPRIQVELEIRPAGG